MSPRDLWSRRKPIEQPGPHGGYFALHEAYGDEPSVADRFEDWDRRLGDETPGKRTWFGRRKRWWIARGVAALLGIFMAAMPGIAAMVRSALEKAGTSFSLNWRLIFSGVATAALAAGLADTSFGCAFATPPSAALPNQ